MSCPLVRAILSRALLSLLLVVLVLGGALAPSGAAAENGDAENIARGKPYTLRPAPGYRHCTDPGDTEQLTDGRLTEGYFWVQQGTVGWQRQPRAVVTIDLGRVEPISAITFRTAAGTAGVGWPSAVLVLVSDDGKSYRLVDDLVELDQDAHGPWPEGYAVRQLVGRGLDTRGRFVRLIVVPSAGTPFIFCDEIEVFRGPDSLLEQEPRGKVIADVNQYMDRIRFSAAVRQRYGGDWRGIARAIDEADLLEARRESLRVNLDKQYNALKEQAIPALKGFRAILPYNDAHAALFQVQAELWRAVGRPELTVWVPATWDPIDLFALPPDGGEGVGRLEVHAMRGEYRAAAVNVAGSTEKPQQVRLHVEGLPGGPTPDWLTVAAVPWTDTAVHKPVLAALPELEPADGAWTFTALPGLVRQAWLTVHPTDVPPGEHRGHVVLHRADAEPVRIPMQLNIYPPRFPEETTLLVGGWSYTNGRGSYGVNPTNRPAFLRHCREHFVNCPWASRGPLMQFTFDEQGRITLDTTEMDDWLDQWPWARRYCFFLGLGGLDRGTRATFAGAELGTKEFDRRVGAWISAWVDHWRGRGIEPSQIAILGHDEPRGEADVAAILAWVKAIRAAEPEVLNWTDPVYRNPAEAPARLFQGFDVLCPNRPMWLQQGAAFAEFYLDQQRQGRELQFYSCSGPARRLDPYAYYRLQAWHAWKVGATGSFFWALGDNGSASSWNPYMANHGPYTPLFIDDSAVTAGKRMEAIRESVEDFETFVMLRRAVREAQQAGTNEAVIDEARALLSAGVDDVLAASGADKISLTAEKDRRRADAARVRMLGALSALTAE